MPGEVKAGFTIRSALLASLLFALLVTGINLVGSEEDLLKCDVALQRWALVEDVCPSGTGGCPTGSCCEITETQYSNCCPTSRSYPLSAHVPPGMKQGVRIKRPPERQLLCCRTLSYIQNKQNVHLLFTWQSWLRTSYQGELRSLSAGGSKRLHCVVGHTSMFFPSQSRSAILCYRTKSQLGAGVTSPFSFPAGFSTADTSVSASAQSS
jgi:hypothetical protein